MKKWIKTHWATGCHLLRLPEVKRWLQERVAILCYHRVLPRKKMGDVLSSPWLIVFRDSFERQMVYLKRHSNVMPLSACLALLASGAKLPPKATVVTFDDGWEDNYLYAFPILRRHRIPATFFLTTGFIGADKVFWPEKVTFYLRKLRKENPGSKETLESLSILPETDFPLLTTSDPDRWIEYLKMVSAATRRTILEELARRVPEMNASQLHANRLMSWDQAREMLESGMEFGAHGHSHRLLTDLSPDEIEEEVRRSKITIEAHLNIPIDTFAYPNGNYDDEIIGILRKEGYRAALTVDKGLTSRRLDPFLLKRLCMDEMTLSSNHGQYSEAVFASYLGGLL